jgi:2-polyprenyl-3-methyl-5-hydroxy-6-metoxy-1,4-benzoquinol methylase
VAKRLYGVDLDGSGLERLRAAGFGRLYQADVEQLQDLGERFEIVVAGELVEHLANPGRFLRAITRHLSEDGKLIVTVPSAQSIRIIANAIRMREVVHPEHNAYYSPSTLRHLLESHGFEIEEIRPYWTEARKSRLLLSLYDRAIRATRLLSPWLGEGLIAVARYRNTESGR